MSKRLLQIFLAAWLINALVCFHPVFSDGVYPHAVPCETSLSHPDNTLVEIIYNHLFADKSHKGHKGHHTRPKYRYLVSRNLGLDLCTAQVAGFFLSNPGKQLPAFIPRIWENRIFLPPLHHFLFRLSPF